jgi:hypothetical protein
MMAPNVLLKEERRNYWLGPEIHPRSSALLVGFYDH